MDSKRGAKFVTMGQDDFGKINSELDGRGMVTA